METRALGLNGGQILQPLIATNQRGLRTWDCGLWSSAEVPHQLHPIIQNPQRYLEAINIINGVSRQEVRFRTERQRVQFVVSAVVIFLVSAAFLVIPLVFFSVLSRQFEIPLGVKIGFLTFGGFVFTLANVRLMMFERLEGRRIVRELQKAVGRANLFLFEEDVLMGTECNSVLSVVYVSLDGCRRTTSPEQFNEAVLKYSCGYTCCLAKQQYPFAPPPGPGHLMGGVCFCQYVHHKQSSIMCI